MTTVSGRSRWRWRCCCCCCCCCASSCVTSHCRKSICEAGHGGVMGAGRCSAARLAGTGASACATAQCEHHSTAHDTPSKCSCAPAVGPQTARSSAGPPPEHLHLFQCLEQQGCPVALRLLPASPASGSHDSSSHGVLCLAPLCGV
jgi:hypothetical protein